MMKKVLMSLMVIAVICGAASAGVNPAEVNLSKEEVARIHSIRQEIAILLQEADALGAIGADYRHIKEQIADLNGQLPAPPRDSGSLDEGGETCADAVAIPSLPYCDTGNTSDNVDDYQPAADADCSTVPPGGQGPDVVYQYTPDVTEIVTISLCGSGFDTYLHVYANACPGDPDAVQVCCDDDFCAFAGPSCCLEVVLPGGTTYYIIVDGWRSGSSGDYTLNVVPFTGFCPETTCDPIIYGACCDPATGVCTDNVPAGDCLAPNTFHPNMLCPAVGCGVPCDADGSVTLPFWWEEPILLEGSTLGAGDDCPTRNSEDDIWEIVVTRPCQYRFDMCVNAPGGDPCAWDSYMYLDAICCDPTGGHIASGDDCPGIGCFGMSSIDCIFLDVGTYYLLIEGYSANDAGDYIVTVECCFDCDLPYNDVDHGDLSALCYPTLVGNPAHALTGVAWLGQGITGEPAPFPPNGDAADDGVTFLSLPWHPCQVESVDVAVTAGPNYTQFVEQCCGCLFLNGWKDGNLDGDFCDTLCTAGGLFADEWIVQDVPVTPGIWRFLFIDPGLPGGVPPGGPYDMVTRWRLTSQPVGREGFGLWPGPGTPCPDCGTYAFDIVGEVEDYIREDAQLSVELNEFNAIPGDEQVTLNWSTASETDNDHFDILRDGTIMSRVNASNSATGDSYTWTDVNLINGREYTYTLVSVDVSGIREEIATTSSTPTLSAATVTEYALHQNYPNPFNPATTISFDLVESVDVMLTVYNPLGQEITTLINGNMPQGRHTVNFNANDLPSGLYFYRLETGDFTSTQKMILMK